MPEAHAEKIARFADLVHQANNAYVFTGAGCSTESGIKDFRSPDGVWSRFRIITLSEFLKSNDARIEQWALHRQLYRELAAAAPNAAHKGIAALYSQGLVGAVVTQNIENLHQRAGVPSKDVIELHGNEFGALCLDCGRRYDRDVIQTRLEEGLEVPLCDACHGLLKTTTVWFGEQLPQAALDRAFDIAGKAGLCIVVGSSLVVYPAAMVPETTVSEGGSLVIINRDPTHLDEYASIIFREPAGQVFDLLVSKLAI